MRLAILLGASLARAAPAHAQDAGGVARRSNHVALNVTEAAGHR